MVDRAFLERFVTQFADRAYSFALSLAADEHKARELVQEAFVRVFDHAEGLDPQRLDQWFLTVMRRIHIDSVRLMDNRPKVDFDFQVSPGVTVADAVADDRDEALSARLERGETAELVRGALERLTPEHRAILALIDMQGLGYDEAAATLGIPLNTARSRIVRARDALRAVLLDMEVTP